MLDQCQRCQSLRVIQISARAKDMHTYKMGEEEYEGYGVGPFGEGDSTELRICLNCGQVQDEFPHPPCFLEPDYEET